MSSNKMKTLTINGVQYTIADETVGSLSDLHTTDKSSVVAAVNEVASNAGSGSGGSSVTIDATLTQEGQAADAKAVGDAIKELSSDSSENVELDTTLTVEGKAADAKAVGVALNDKLAASKLPEAVNEALAQAKASGEFDGEDYILTEADKQEIAEQAAQLVDVPTDDHINDLINTAMGVIENGTY